MMLEKGLQLVQMPLLVLPVWEYEWSYPLLGSFLCLHKSPVPFAGGCIECKGRTSWLIRSVFDQGLRPEGKSSVGKVEQQSNLEKKSCPAGLPELSVIQAGPSLPRLKYQNSSSFIFFLPSGGKEWDGIACHFGTVHKRVLILLKLRSDKLLRIGPKALQDREEPSWFGLEASQDEPIGVGRNPLSRCPSVTVEPRAAIAMNCYNVCLLLGKPACRCRQWNWHCRQWIYGSHALLDDPCFIQTGA